LASLNEKIDWSRPAEEIHALVCAMTRPGPGASAEFQGKRMKVWKTQLSSERCKGGDRPGTSFNRGARFLVVCGGQTLLEIIEKE
jgi:methionyl-tRNA formyltransferase